MRVFDVECSGDGDSGAVTGSTGTIDVVSSISKNSLSANVAFVLVPP